MVLRRDCPRPNTPLRLASNSAFQSLSGSIEASNIGCSFRPGQRECPQRGAHPVRWREDRQVARRLPSEFSVRAEAPDDSAAVFEVVADAFPTESEAALVDELRGATDPQISLVAEMGGFVVGHVLFTPVEIQAPDRVIQGMGLAPLAVREAYQRQLRDVSQRSLCAGGHIQPGLQLSRYGLLSPHCGGQSWLQEWSTYRTRFHQR